MAEQEELGATRPDLDGAQIMALLGLAPGPLVGKAYKFLLEERMDHGPLGAEEAQRRLHGWWQEHGPGSPAAEESTGSVDDEH